MNELDRDALDRWLLGGSYDSRDVLFQCSECEHTWQGQLVREYGQHYAEPEECPSCGASGDALVVTGDA